MHCGALVVRLACPPVLNPPSLPNPHPHNGAQVSTLTVRRYYRPEDISQEQVGWAEGPGSCGVIRASLWCY